MPFCVLACFFPDRSASWITQRGPHKNKTSGATEGKCPRVIYWNRYGRNKEKLIKPMGPFIPDSPFWYIQAQTLPKINMPMTMPITPKSKYISPKFGYAGPAAAHIGPNMAIVTFVTEDTGLPGQRKRATSGTP